MKLKDVKELLNADVLCGEDQLDNDIEGVFASDFMSDILAFTHDQKLLVTGMMNPQVIRTAEMVDFQCVVFIRGKVPSEDIIELARECGMIVMTSKLLMFTSCGILYTNGMR